MALTDNQSFRRYLIDELTMYSRRAGPIQFEGKSERYTRAIVSAFNTDKGTSYSVLRHGKGLLVGLRSDCRNYQPEPTKQPPVAVSTVELSAAEHLQRAVELLRAQCVSREEMHAELSKYITSKDDYLI